MCLLNRLETAEQSLRSVCREGERLSEMGEHASVLSWKFPAFSYLNEPFPHILRVDMHLYTAGKIQTENTVSNHQWHDLKGDVGQKEVLKEQDS